MPNPPIHLSGELAPAAPRGEAANGILAYVGGPYVAQGSQMLPKACATEQKKRSVVLDVPELGLVRITYLLNTYRHRKSHFWHWVAEHAERVPPSP